MDRMAMEQALVSAGDVRVALRDTLTGATAVEALVILPLIERAATLARDIEALLAAREADEKGGR